MIKRIIIVTTENNQLQTALRKITIPILYTFSNVANSNNSNIISYKAKQQGRHFQNLTNLNKNQFAN